jgi:hypothetical protein
LAPGEYRLAGDVVERIGRYLVHRGAGVYVGGAPAKAIRDQEARAALPRARQLHAELCRLVVPPHAEASARKGGSYAIGRIEPDRVWLEPLIAEEAIGPFALPERVTAQCQEDWLVTAFVWCRDGWHFSKVHHVEPFGLDHSRPAERTELRMDGQQY